MAKNKASKKPVPLPPGMKPFGATVKDGGAVKGNLKKKRGG